MTTTQIHLWTVEEYHRTIDAGILTPDDKIELLEGKMVIENKLFAMEVERSHP